MTTADAADAVSALPCSEESYAAARETVRVRNGDTPAIMLAMGSDIMRALGRLEGKTENADTQRADIISRLSTIEQQTASQQTDINGLKSTVGKLAPVVPWSGKKKVTVWTVFVGVLALIGTLAVTAQEIAAAIKAFAQ